MPADGFFTFSGPPVLTLAGDVTKLRVRAPRASGMAWTSPSAGGFRGGCDGAAHPAHTAQRRGRPRGRHPKGRCWPCDEGACPPPPMHRVGGRHALSPGLSSSGFLQRWKFTSDERESDPASPRKENRERSEEKTAQKKCIEGSSFFTPPCQPLVTTTLTGLLQSQRITLSIKRKSPLQCCSDSAKPPRRWAAGKAARC